MCFALRSPQSRAFSPSLAASPHTRDKVCTRAAESPHAALSWTRAEEEQRSLSLPPNRFTFRGSAWAAAVDSTTTLSSGDQRYSPPPTLATTHRPPNKSQLPQQLCPPDAIRPGGENRPSGTWHRQKYGFWLSAGSGHRRCITTSPTRPLHFGLVDTSLHPPHHHLRLLTRAIRNSFPFSRLL